MARFLSLATVSQLMVVAAQLALLPLQIHGWGHEVAAVWLAAMAGVTLISVADLGLRNAAYAALATGDPYFHTLWSAIRVLTFALCAILAVILTVAYGMRLAPDQRAFAAILSFASGCELLLTVRGVLLECRGRIVMAEALFAAFLTVRVVLGAILLGVFHVGPAVFAVHWFLCAALALLAQSRVGTVIADAPLAPRWDFSQARRAVEDARLSVSTPLVAWVQMGVPVLALSTFAPAATVSGFVAIRTLFGLVRTMVLQFSRLVSIRYVDRVTSGRGADGAALVLLAAAAAAWVGAGVGLAVFAENFWLTGRLFDLAGDIGDRFFALAFAMSSTLAVHQIFNLSLAREGAFRTLGPANYLYIAVIGLVCVISVATRTVTSLVLGLVVADAMLLVLNGRPFMRGEAPLVRGLRLMFMATMAGLMVLLVAGWTGFMWRSGADAGRSLLAVIASMAIAGVVWLGVGAVLWLRARGPAATLLARSA